MHKLRYHITTKAPLVISAKHGDMNMTATEKHIPSGTVLGILAGRFMNKKNITDNAHKNEDFYNWFLTGNLKITSAYIYTKNDDNEEFINFPVPVSIQKGKYTKNVVDLLYFDAQNIQTQAINKFCKLDKDTLYTKEVKTSLNFHHARDRIKGIPEQGKIFNYESIMPGQIFEGEIQGSKDDLQSFISISGKSWTAHAGRSKNTQYGEIKFNILSDTPAPVEQADITDDEISLTLLSDTIIYNEFGYSTTDKNEFENYLSNLVKGIKITNAFVKKGDVETFTGIWRLKKPSETCFLAGSVFLLDISGADKNALNKLWENGIGERTHEGYGMCKLGLQTEDKLTQDESQDKQVKFPKPPYPLPDQTKHIFVKIIKNYITGQAQLTAFDEQAGFKTATLIPNSLAGKLQAMAKAKGKDGFADSIGDLKETAKNNLKNCHNEKKILFNFIKDKKELVESIMSSSGSKQVKDLCKEIDYNPAIDSDFEKSLYKLYFTTFFSMMRKRKKN
jgi:CRISPR-associated protein Csx10